MKRIHLSTWMVCQRELENQTQNYEFNYNKIINFICILGQKQCLDINQDLSGGIIDITVLFI